MPLIGEISIFSIVHMILRQDLRISINYFVYNEAIDETKTQSGAFSLA